MAEVLAKDPDGRSARQVLRALGRPRLGHERRVSRATRRRRSTRSSTPSSSRPCSPESRATRSGRRPRSTRRSRTWSGFSRSGRRGARRALPTPIPRSGGPRDPGLHLRPCPSSPGPLGAPRLGITGDGVARRAARASYAHPEVRRTEGSRTSLATMPVKPGIPRRDAPRDDGLLALGMTRDGAAHFAGQKKGGLGGRPGRMGWAGSSARPGLSAPPADGIHRPPAKPATGIQRPAAKSFRNLRSREFRCPLRRMLVQAVVAVSPWLYKKSSIGPSSQQLTPLQSVSL